MSQNRHLIERVEITSRVTFFRTIPSTAGLSSPLAGTSQHEASPSNRLLLLMRAFGLFFCTSISSLSTLRDSSRPAFQCIICRQTTGHSLIYHCKLCPHALYSPGSCRPCIYFRHFGIVFGNGCSCQVNRFAEPVLTLAALYGTRKFFLWVWRNRNRKILLQIFCFLLKFGPRYR
jgi:hypothetical protein